MNDGIRVPESVRSIMEAGGWRPGRRVKRAEIKQGHPASAVLEELNGLHVGSSGPGEECASGDLHFHHVREEIRTVEEWASILRTDLVGVALARSGQAVLLMADDGRCFSYGFVDEGFRFVGRNIEEALERELLGRKSQVLIPPNRDYVMHYGVRCTRGSAASYQYEDKR